MHTYIDFEATMFVKVKLHIITAAKQAAHSALFLNLYKLFFRAFNLIGASETQILPRQQTSYFS